MTESELRLAALLDNANETIGRLRAELIAAHNKNAELKAQVAAGVSKFESMQIVQRATYLTRERVEIERDAALRRLNLLRAELLIWKLSRRRDCSHSGNCKYPRRRREIAEKRIERVKEMVAK